MKSIIILNMLMVSVVLNMFAQSTLDSVLATIEKNNKALILSQRYVETQKLAFKTGLAPSDPVLQYDYLFGSPAAAGNQTDMSVTQAFDFPSAYIKKKQLADQQILQADMILKTKRQEVLLEAKLLCIQLTHLNKLKNIFAMRQADIAKIATDFQTKLDNGDGNAMDVNKARLQLIEMDKELQLNQSHINQLNQQLTELNGGQTIVFADTSYPLPPKVIPFEQLEGDIQANDPLRKYLQQEREITQKQLEVGRALWLPKLEAGYHYQAILGQRYNGLHAGISIPLWEKKGTVKLQKSQIMFADMKLQEHDNGHFYEIKQLYERYENLKVILARYRDVFQTLDNKPLLDKSLDFGQISTIEYFMEIGYYFNALNGYLETERDYHIVLAELYQYTL